MASIVIAGDTSGAVTIAAPATAGTPTLTLPTTSGTIAVTGGSPSFSTMTVTGNANFATSSGNVGIGNSSPVSKLDVTGIARFSSTSFVAPSGGRGVEVWYQTDSDKGFTGAFDRGGSVYKPFQLFGSQIEFNLNGSEAMRIDSSGNVGIGTSSPASKLHVTVSPGAHRLGVNGSDVNYNVRANAGSNASITWTEDGISDRWTVGCVTGQNYLAFRAGSSNMTNGTEQLRITSGGNMVFANRSGAGNTQQLVVGTTTSSGSINSYGAFIADSSSPYPLGVKGLSNAQGMVGFFNSSDTVIGEISKNTASVNYSTTSDYRLKENIAPMTGALDKVKALKPVTYTWKIDGSAGQGFIAHELQAVVPDCVTGEKDGVETYIDEEGNEQTRPKYQGVDTSFLVATLTAAIQELNAKVEAQAAEIAALKGVK